MSNFIGYLTDGERYLPYVKVLFTLTMLSMFADVVVRGIVLFTSIGLSDGIVDGTRIVLGFLVIGFFVSLIMNERHFSKREKSLKNK